MEVISRKEFDDNKKIYFGKILNGAVFIYPTDTIYGIGCDARNDLSVKRIRGIKRRRGDKPFSVIAPSEQWISKNCEIDENAKKWIERLPDRLTLILKKRDKKIVSPEVGKDNFLGVRIPKHWFSEIVKELSIPIVTTSVNKTGESFMTSLDDLDEGIKKEVDFIIYEGRLKNNPSKIVNLSEKKIIER